MTIYGKPKVNNIRHGGIGQYDPKFIADAAYICDGCKRMSVVTWTTTYDPNHTRWNDYGRGDGPEEYERYRWSPAPGHQMDFPDTPDQIAEAASEGWLCHASGAHLGAVMLARAVVESTAKAKGITEGSLFHKIEEMAAKGLIRAAVKDQAHEVRHFGNGSAHGDLGDPVTSEDAEEVLNLMGEVINEVWQSPERAKRLAAARAAKRSNP